MEQGSDDPVAVFVELDGQGKTNLHPSDPQLLCDALDGKKLLNLMIAEWASGYSYCGGWSYVEEELMTTYPFLPEWVWQAVRNQYYASL